MWRRKGQGTIMNELVSAVITTYKREPKILKRAIDSVVGQTYNPIEIIVVDDSPPDYKFRDDIKKLIESFDIKIHYVRHETNKGACIARNTGLNIAHGTYIAYLDDDDEWLSNKIEKQIQEFRCDDIALVCCQIWVVKEKTGRKKIQPKSTYEGYVYPQLICDNFIGSTSFPLIRKKMLEEIGGFDPLMESSQDFDVWTRLAKKYKVAFIKEPLGIYHWHEGDQITKNPQRKISGMERINEKNIDYLNRDRRAKWCRTIKLVPLYAKNLQLGKALVIWGNAVVRYPFGVYTNIEYLLRIVKGYSEAYKNKKNNVKQ